MNKNSTVFLLMLEESQNDAEHVASLLRNAGVPTRANRIENEEDLVEALNQQPWDLFFVRMQKKLDLAPLTQQIEQMERDLPVIALVDNYDPEQVINLLKDGAKDVIPFSSEKHIVLAARRELANLKTRRRLRELELQINDAEERCELLLDNSKDAVAYVNDGMHVYANASYMNFLGYEELDDLICVPVLDTLDAESQEKYKAVTKSLQEKGSKGIANDIPIVTERSDGTSIKVLLSLSEASYDGERCLQIILRPEQGNAELEEKLREMSQLDLLTGLYNRNYFMDHLNDVKELTVKHGKQFALMYMAVDSFQKLKADLGIADADLILRDLAQVLNEENDLAQVLGDEESSERILARLSDDIFALACPVANAEQAEAIAEGYRKHVEDHLFEVEGRTQQLTISIGITLVTENSPNTKDMLGRAQTASEEVSKNQGNAVSLYRPKRENPLNDPDIAVTLIDNALANDGFKLLYQPIIGLRGQGEEHYEALIRMINDKGEEVSPYEFMPPTGPSEMASKIDKWVILQTIRQLSEHRAKGHNTKLFINITSETLQDKTFISWLNVALQAGKLPGDALIFQIPENNAITYMKQAKDFAKGIQSLRCKFAINQFGLALNPFNLLKHMEPEYIKLEGTFTKDLQKDETAKEQAKQMIQQLQEMGRMTIIPFVESAAILSVLWQVGAHYIQGYYLQAPSARMEYDFSEE